MTPLRRIGSSTSVHDIAASRKDSAMTTAPRSSGMSSSSFGRYTVTGKCHR